MRKMSKVLALIISIAVVCVNVMGSTVSAAQTQESNNRVLIDSVVLKLDKNGNITTYTSSDPRPYEERAIIDVEDASVATIAFWDIGYESATNLHTYEVSYAIRLIDKECLYYFVSSKLTIKPTNLNSLSNTIRYDTVNHKRVAADAIDFYYSGNRVPDNVKVQATLAVNVAGLGAYTYPTQTLTNPKVP